ncbi:MAG TPA: hypothetical protein PK970_03250 [Hyphomicrobiaceae bacterium]|nr:hypothetical protein [Hyphomicrobiaceae bacterium]
MTADGAVIESGEAQTTVRAAFDAIEAEIDRVAGDTGCDPAAAAGAFLGLGERVLEIWVEGRGDVPTRDQKEGFRLLALHRQGAKGEPSFNACRETCRELAYHYNLITLEPGHAETPQRVRVMGLVVRHLCLFVSGKMQVAGLGEFCCSSKPLRGDGK